MQIVVDRKFRSVADIGAKLIKLAALDAGWTEALAVDLPEPREAAE
ncbi:MAG: hypothetical protein NW217_00285 [Hyphomicrobiaceae bacterium]|nr:hypothetical protein [Hyphomicrobiaceae bacterium]